MAAAIEAIDEGVDASEEILTLLQLIAETVAVNLRLRKKDYRMYFVVPKPQDPNSTSQDGEKKGLLSGVRIGRQFEKVGKTLTTTDFKKITDMDSMNVETFLGVDVTEVTSLANMETQGAHALLFIRNPGKHLRLGLYVAVLKETDAEDLETYEEMFGRVAQIVTTLGFIDAVSQFVVNYQ
ncbi:hypothetical protein [Alicyclobacillus fastidiosus]|uniref:hypothetical protein n=1 Tax=Alicyclobacillus fastidiosus TaxID=392011 RepID=UPI0023E9B4A9|nr:hypothetical protein [Alicyclobacillus fastidiosus]GMA65953.1 hypothetical protein GCM10025859_63950 [Alicyclobacillus fastidiosus]GMA66173.1 hypothetical protein GCM10025859_66150 [Alicyclobacillus fastidiosus]